MYVGGNGGKITNSNYGVKKIWQAGDVGCKCHGYSVNLHLYPWSKSKMDLWWSRTRVTPPAAGLLCSQQTVFVLFFFSYYDDRVSKSLILGLVMASLLAFFPCNFWCGRSIICSEILSAGEAPFKPPISPSRHPKSPLSMTHFDISLKAVNRGTPAALKQSTEDIYLTGGAFDFKGATESLTSRSLPVVKKVILVRHGLSSWNAESRIQGSSDQSTLSTNGALQSEKCGKALSKLKFDRCFASPISRAKASAEIIWKGRQQPLVFLDALKEANLLFLEGMKNVDARTQYPEMYKAWREDPENFNINGVYPVVELWGQARRAWKEIVSTPGELFLLVSHKSILRAMISTALGLGPNRFRAIDINNCGISVFVINDRGEPMLQCLNRTAHLHMDDVYY